MKALQLIILLLLLGTGASTFAQKYTPGYLIKDEGDTLYGLVRSDYNYLYFKKDQKDQYTKFKLKNIKGYMVGDQVYVPDCFEVIQNNFVERRCGFLKLLEKGEVCLYMYYGSNLYNQEKHPNLYVKRGEAGPWLVKEDAFAFRREMAQLFADHPELPSKIKNKNFTYDDTQTMVSMYNEWAAGQAQNP
ncbi:MAG: hypothetical protein H6581_07655 [Bacteroidia bacterium]|nr:hypothetical protein [Bacteroidia bacterium]